MWFKEEVSRSGIQGRRKGPGEKLSLCAEGRDVATQDRNLWQTNYSGEKLSPCGEGRDAALKDWNLQQICSEAPLTREKICERKSTGGDTPRRQLARKAGGALIATAAAARPTVPPYPQRSPLLKLGMTASSEPQAMVSSEPQTGSLLEPSVGASPEPDTHEVQFYMHGLPYEHEANMSKWLKHVSSYDRVVVFITTHVHDTTSNLYGGPEVLTALFLSTLRKAFKDRTIYLNFLTRTAQEWHSSKLLTSQLLVSHSM
ncbi:hypothetical protein FIBSPDRAFT_884274 [Athelia psychrophila]|uniref:Uncharacterized protein n=1 Tax=Athelia psychrophila TaxID=1759441 RepID=A0A166T912_9AGAM|nr:hypothetical protein FIBSPDRAFT_884274 [Fibularhizoctonia sp. CBS 109695]